MLPFTKGIKKSGRSEGRVGKMHGSGSSVLVGKSTEDVLQRAENSESAEMHWAVETEFLFMSLCRSKSQVSGFFFVSTYGTVQGPV